MIKMFLKFLVCATVFLSSAYVPVAYATSNSVVLTHIQVGGVGAVTNEFIVIYNNSPLEVDITDWCLTNRNNVTITCFAMPTGQARYLPAYKHALVASDSMTELLPSHSVTASYVPANKTSGSIAGKADTISLIDSGGVVVDDKSWDTPVSGGMQFVRSSTGADLVVYIDTDTSADWKIVTDVSVPVDETEIEGELVDVCPNSEGAQLVLPDGQAFNEVGECVDRVIATVNITEILPNAAGSDVGKEFIELYNPNDFSVDMADYLLYIGPQFDDIYSFPAGSIIQPLSYKSFSNAEIPFSLLNSSSRVSLRLADGTVIDETPLYDSPKDGQSWALVDDDWLYTALPTPGFINQLVIESVIEKAEATLQVCAANQYRSLETNRCRLVSTKTGTVTPCKDNQYRSEETNRCRTIASDTKTATECAEGQERNPATNRCRTITKMPDAGYGVAGAETKQEGSWYVWAAIGGVLLLALGYAVWEWHVEIGKFFRTRYFRALQLVRTHK